MQTQCEPKLDSEQHTPSRVNLPRVLIGSFVAGFLSVVAVIVFILTVFFSAHAMS
ncbi:MAG: hypothetical protein AAF517_20565 [Planctomycetota bacterium]